MVLIMRRILRIVVPTGLILLTSTLSFAQHGKLRYADHQSELFNYSEAAKGYEDSYADKATYRAAKGAARTYDRLASYDEASKWWARVVEFGEATIEDHAGYATSLQRTGDLDKLTAVLASVPAASNTGNISLDSLNKWYTTPVNVELIGLDELNSSAADYGIAFDQQGKTYFSSDRGEVPSLSKKSIRIDGSDKFDPRLNETTGRDFIKIYKQDGDGQAVAVKSPVPGTFHFADPSFMKEKQLVFYSLTRDLGKVKKNRDYTVKPELFYSSVDASGELGDYQAFPYNSVLEHGIITPFVDEKEKKIYFASDREGGLGGYDLYFVTYDEGLNFGPPVNLGPSVNTAGNERDPFVVDGMFYFASDGQVGLGGLDVFQANLSSGSITGVRNMGMPYNSPQDDFAFRRLVDGKMYMSSNRGNGKGIDDIFKIEDLYRQFIAKVIDCEGSPISDGLQVTLSQKGNLAAIDTQQEGNGIFKAQVAPDSDFQLILSKQGYFSISDDELSSRGVASSQWEKEYVMKRIPYKSVVLEDTIYYDLDDFKIRADAEPVMKKLAETLKQFTFLEIIVRSHTDSRASDEYNQTLSQKRANAIRDFLGDYGVARARVKSEWFGEQSLLNDCGDGVRCPDSAHQQNRRSELILIAFPDENETYEFPKELEGIDASLFKDLKFPVDCQ